MPRKQTQKSNQKSGNGTQAIVPRSSQIKSLIMGGTGYIHDVLPKNLGLSPDRFAKVVINCIMSDPKKILAQCTDASLVRAMLHAAEVGLEPGGAYAHAYLIPYFNKDRGAYEASFMMGVWGFVHLAYRSTKVVKVWADVIRQEDKCEVTGGTGGIVITHRPAWRIPEDERGPIVAAYACAKLADGDVMAKMTSSDEILKARLANRGKSPAWQDWEAEMACKVAIKRASKLWPKGDDGSLDRAIEMEDKPEVMPASIARAVAEVEGVEMGESALDREVRKRQAAAEDEDQRPPDDSGEVAAEDEPRVPGED